MNKNLAICLRDDEYFTKNTVYPCYGVNEGMTDIQADDGKPVTVDCDDSDFVIILNVTEELKEFLKEKYTFKE